MGVLTTVVGRNRPTEYGGKKLKEFSFKTEE